MDPGTHDRSRRQLGGSHQRFLVDAMPLERRVGDSTSAEDFSFAVSGGRGRPLAGQPEVQIVDRAEIVRWGEQSPDDPECVLWYEWDVQRGRPECGFWPIEAWPPPVLEFLGECDGIIWRFLGWAAGKAGLSRDDLGRALVSGKRIVVEDANVWFARFLGEYGEVEAVLWHLLWAGALPIKEYELRNEAGELEGEGLLVDAGADTDMRHQLRQRLVLCVLGLTRRHHLERVLAEAYPDTRGGPVLLAWTAVLPWDDEEAAADMWVAALKKIDVLYVKARSEGTHEEHLANALRALVDRASAIAHLRKPISVLREKGDVEQVEDILSEGMLCACRATERYNLFEHTPAMAVYVGRNAAERMKQARRSGRKREEREMSSTVPASAPGIGEGQHVDMLDETGKEDPMFSEGETLATVELLAARAPLSESQRRTVSLYCSARRRFPTSPYADLVREMARQEGVSENTMRQRLKRLKERLTAQT
jgi:hypothetical protein